MEHLCPPHPDTDAGWITALDAFMADRVRPRLRRHFKENDERWLAAVWGFEYYRRDLLRLAKTLRIPATEPEQAPEPESGRWFFFLKGLTDERLLALAFEGDGAAEARAKLDAQLAKLTATFDAITSERVTEFRAWILSDPERTAIVKEALTQQGEKLLEAFVAQLKPASALPR